MISTRVAPPGKKNNEAKMKPTSTCVIVAPDKTEEEKGLLFASINTSQPNKCDKVQDAIVQLSTLYVNCTGSSGAMKSHAVVPFVVHAYIRFLSFLFFYRSVFHSLHSHLLSTYP